MRRVESSFVSRHGHALCAHAWEHATPGAAEPMAVLVLAHGYSNYTGAFFDWKASLLSAYGIAVYGVDHFAHGKSDGLPCYMPDFNVVRREHLHSQTACPWNCRSMLQWS